MINIKSKKGFFLFGFSLIMFFLMIYAVFVFFGDRPDVDDNARLGQMVFDVYNADIEVSKYGFFINKVGEYSLIGAMKEGMSKGLIGDCMVEGNYVLYNTNKCNFNPELLVSNFSDNIGVYFDKYVTRISSKNYTFETRFNGTSIFLKGDSNAELNFAKESNKKFNFTKDIDFEIYFDYDFSWFNEMESNLKSNLDCLGNAKDEQQLENIAIADSDKTPSNCLNEYPEFSDIRKINGLLHFNYLADGHLFEEGFNIPLIVDLGNIQLNILQKDVSL